MQWSDSKLNSEWRNKLYLDRWFSIYSHTNNTGVNNDDDIYGNGQQRKLQRHSSIYGNGKSDTGDTRHHTKRRYIIQQYDNSRSNVSVV